MVTGPSLTRATCMSAPKTPVATGRPVAAARAEQNWSQSGAAESGRAARMKDGRFPFFTAAKRVNWETTRRPPEMSVTERFMRPESSAKMRRREILPVR